MKRILFACALAILPAAALAQAPRVGPLDARNNLSEIASAGSAAQAAARTNLGLSGAPLTVPASPLLGGTAGAFVPVSPGCGAAVASGTLSITFGTTTCTALQGSLLGAASGVAGLDGNALVPLAQLPTGTSGSKIPLLSGANTWSGAQRFTATTTTAGITDSGGISTTGALTVGAVNSSSSSTQVVFKNGPGGALMLQMGGNSADIEPQTDIVLPGGTWGSGTLANTRAPIFQNATFAGTSGSTAGAFGAFLQQTDNSSVANGAQGLMEHLILNGSGVVGGREAGQFTLDISAATGNTSGKDYVGIGMKCNLLATDVGGASSCFGSNPVSHIGTNVTALQNVGEEVDTWEQSGAVITDRIGEQIVDTVGSTYGTQAARDDVSLSLNNQYAQSSALGFKIGFEFGRAGGQFPVATNGTLIYGQGNLGLAWTVANGIDWRLGTFTANLLQTPNTSIDGSGNLRLGEAFLQPTTNGLTVNPTGSIGTAGTVQSGGSGYPTTTPAFDLTDPYGGVWKGVTNASGVITSVVLVSPPYTPGSVAAACTVASPCALTSPAGATGSGATISVAWQTGGQTKFLGALASNGTPGVTCSGTPTASFATVGGLVTHC